MIDTTVKIWNFKTKSPMLTFSGHKNKVNTVVFTPSENFVVTGSKDKAIKNMKV